MRFATPLALLLLLAVPVLVALWRRRRNSGPAFVLPSLQSVAASRRSPRARLYPLLLLLRCLAVAAVALALARPQGLGRPIANYADAIDVFVVLDVSSSMGSQDFQPLNRLEVAKRVITAFVEGRPVDRIGLITFARFSTLKCPLTLDHELLRAQLSKAELASGDDDGTAIGMALASAVNHLRRSPAKSRIVVLLTDGENNRSTIEPETGAELARSFGARVYTIGVGRNVEDRPQQPPDPFANRRHAAFNAEGLQAISAATSGRYFGAEDLASLSAVFATIDELERSPVPAPSDVETTERFQALLLSGLLLAAVDLLLRHTLLRRLP